MQQHRPLAQVLRQLFGAYHPQVSSHQPEASFRRGAYGSFVQQFPRFGPLHRRRNQLETDFHLGVARYDTVHKCSGLHHSVTHLHCLHDRPLPPGKPYEYWLSATPVPLQPELLRARASYPTQRWKRRYFSLWDTSPQISLFTRYLLGS